MNQIEAITLAIAAASAARFRPNGLYLRRPEGQAYQTLRQLLVDKYPAVSHDILDVGPASTERQAILKTQLQQAGVEGDTAVLQQTRQLLQLLLQHDPTSATAVFATPGDLQQAINAIKN
jgi:hypothetical protein